MIAASFIEEDSHFTPFFRGRGWSFDVFEGELSQTEINEHTGC